MTEQSKRERQKENRRQRQERERREARIANIRHRLTQFLTLFVIVAALLAFSAWRQSRQSDSVTTTTEAMGSTDHSDTTQTTSGEAIPPAGYADYREQPTACGGTAPPPITEMQFEAPEDQGLSGLVTATITTSCGDIVAELDPSVAPETVNSFVFLARQGYFDGMAFHRIMDGFMAQTGDQTATGGGGPGYTIPDEFPEAGFVYDRGVVAMANRGPGTSSSQFFIMFGDSSPLPPSYSVFGRVVDSDATLDAIEAVPKGLRGGELSVPLESVYIEGIAIDS